MDRSAPTLRELEACAPATKLAKRGRKPHWFDSHIKAQLGFLAGQAVKETRIRPTRYRDCIVRVATCPTYGVARSPPERRRPRRFRDGRLDRSSSSLFRSIWRRDLPDRHLHSGR